MGYLQNDTSNIILDAVLTDTGRQFLAKNDGSFSIVKWAAADDEIDYSLIQKFGRTVGKEKIEKNTPVFEAITNANLAQKYRCISLSNPNLTTLPNLTLQGDGLDSTTNIVSIGNTTVTKRTLTISQNIANQQTIDVELRDQAFIVTCHNLFLQVLGSAADNIDSSQQATYILTRDSAETSIGGSTLTFTIATKAIIGTQFQIYGAQNNKQLINTFVKVAGVQSGAVYQFQVAINQNS